MSDKTIDPSKFMRPGPRRAKNEQVLSKALWENDEMKSIGRFCERKFAFNPMSRDPEKIKEAAEKFPVMEDTFSWKGVRRKLEEADAATAFPGVLRAGVQTIANNMYQQIGTTFEDWTKAVSSKRDTELYAPLQGIGFPREVGRQEVYPEVGAAGLDISLVNRKYGDIYAVELELLEDDQTGQFQQQAGMLGEYMKELQEVLCYGKLASVANMFYSVFNVPKTETKDQEETSASYPWCPASAPFVGNGFNRPASYSILTNTALQAAYIGLMNQVNKLGLKFAVKGNRLLVGPQQIFTASTLLNSAYFPSVPGAAGSTGGNFAINPVQGLASLTTSRFVFSNDGTVNGNSYAWYLVDDSKPWFVMQLREALLVEQENPTSGDSFNRDVYRFKVRMRGNADFIDPRFAWQGDDGSVTS